MKRAAGAAVSVALMFVLPFIGLTLLGADGSPRWVIALGIALLAGAAPVYLAVAPNEAWHVSRAARLIAVISLTLLALALAMGATAAVLRLFASGA